MDILIPSPLFGEQREVKREWKKISRRAVRLGDWNAALEDTEMVPLSETHGRLILDGPDGAPDWHVFICLVITNLGEMCYLGLDRADESNQKLKQLILNGLRHQWFQLSVLGASPLWLYGANNRTIESPPLAAKALSKLLTLWPSLVSLDDRFGMANGMKNPWPGWRSRPFNLCSELGVSEDELRPIRVAAGKGRLDAWEAATAIRGFVDRWYHDNPGNTEKDL